MKNGGEATPENPEQEAVEKALAIIFADLVEVGDLYCKEQPVCSRYTRKVENIKFGEITQTSLAAAGCLVLFDSRIKEETEKELRRQFDLENEVYSGPRKSDQAIS